MRERAGVAEAEREMERISQEISTGGPRLPDLLRRHEEVQRRFEALEGLNHFTVLDPLADADSGLVRRIAEMMNT